MSAESNIDTMKFQELADMFQKAVLSKNKLDIVRVIDDINDELAKSFRDDNATYQIVTKREKDLLISSAMSVLNILPQSTRINRFHAMLQAEIRLNEIYILHIYVNPGSSLNFVGFIIGASGDSIYYKNSDSGFDFGAINHPSLLRNGSSSQRSVFAEGQRSVFAEGQRSVFAEGLDNSKIYTLINHYSLMARLTPHKCVGGYPSPGLVNYNLVDAYKIMLGSRCHENAPISSQATLPNKGAKQAINNNNNCRESGRKLREKRPIEPDRSSDEKKRRKA